MENASSSVWAALDRPEPDIGDEYLIVEFDEEDKAVDVAVPRDEPTLWERYRACWPW